MFASARLACSCVAFRQILLGDAENAAESPRAPARGCGNGSAAARSLVRSQNTPSGKVFSITSRTQCCASTGVIFQIVGQGDSTSISEKPSPRTWFSTARCDGARRLRDLLVVSQAHALDVDRRLQRGQQLAHVQRIAFGRGAAAVRAWWCSSGPAAWWARPCPPVML